MQHHFILALFIAGMLSPGGVLGEEPRQEAHPQSCAVGPVTKAYGDSQWLGNL